MGNDSELGILDRAREAIWSVTGTNIIAGTIGGIAGVIIGHPFDTVKVSKTLRFSDSLLLLGTDAGSQWSRVLQDHLAVLSDDPAERIALGSLQGHVVAAGRCSSGQCISLWSLRIPLGHSTAQ